MPQDSVIKFPGNLGLMKTVFHKDLPDAKFTTVTISRNADSMYYASIIFNQEDTPVVAIREAIGVDLGLKNFAITSEGSKYDLPKKQLAKLERNRKRQQKKLAQKTDNINSGSLGINITHSQDTASALVPTSINCRQGKLI
jgi:putative transposase